MLFIVRGDIFVVCGDGSMRDFAAAIIGPVEL